MGTNSKTKETHGKALEGQKKGAWTNNWHRRNTVINTGTSLENHVKSYINTGWAWEKHKKGIAHASEKHTKENILERHRKAQEKHGKGIGRRTRKHREGVGRTAEKHKNMDMKA
jgi:hypothetical protein